MGMTWYSLTDVSIFILFATFIHIIKRIEHHIGLISTIHVYNTV